MKERKQGFETLEEDIKASLTQDREEETRESKINDIQENQERATASLSPESKPLKSASPSLLPQVEF